MDDKKDVEKTADPGKPEDKVFEIDTSESEDEAPRKRPSAAENKRNLRFNFEKNGPPKDIVNDDHLVDNYPVQQLDYEKDEAEDTYDTELKLNDDDIPRSGGKNRMHSEPLGGDGPRKKSLSQKLKHALGRDKVEETFGARFSVSATEARARRVSMESSISNDSTIGHAPKTLERPPMIDFYRHSAQGDTKTRPTMAELMGNDEDSDEEPIDQFEERNAKILESQMKPSKKGRGRTIHIGDKDDPEKAGIEKVEANDTPKNKYGWIAGVLVRCVNNIFGVMLYLRMSWVVGQAGIAMGSMIVLLASLVTTITALSMSAICTNGLVKGGGAYYLISRSLGPEFGGSIGIIFSLANAVGAAMYIVGFAETVQDLMEDRDITLVDGGLNDIRIIGLIICIVLMTIIFIGLGFESKLQVFLLIVVFATIFDFYIGSFFHPSELQQIKGMTGYSSKTFMENMFPSFRHGFNFFSVFAIYFPAATGVMAGANISGDLKNPTTAIPKGTLVAIGITTAVYLSVIWVIGASVVRDADGIFVPELLNVSTTLINHGWWPSSAFVNIFGRGTQNYVVPDCAETHSCKYGLMNYFQVFEFVAYIGPLITLGIWAATLSSALLCLVSGPKVFQAVCRDKIFPYISYFAKGYGKNVEPRRAYILSFCICCAIILIGDLNVIAPIISNFYLCTYALVNFACFDTSFAKSPGFRPSFKFYNHWISLVGALLCVSIMFVISWFNALLTFMFFGLLFLYMTHRKPDVNWGSSSQAHSYRHALQYVQKLENIDEHVKNYRPQILVLSGNPAARPSLVDFAHSITKGNNLLVCGHVVPYTLNESVNQMMTKLRVQMRQWFRKRHVKSFYVSVAHKDFRQGAQSLIQPAGLGRLRPNILLIGFKQDWAKHGVTNLKEINNYFGVIQDAFSSQLAVCVLRNSKDGLDFSDIMSKHNLMAGLPRVDAIGDRSSTRGHFAIKGRRASAVLMNAINFKTTPDVGASRNVVSMDLEGQHEEGLTVPQQTRIKSENSEGGGSDSGVERSVESSLRNVGKQYNDDQVEVLMTINRFQFKVKKGTIDLWWLYDDGGLSLLIPYLLTQTKSYLENANLRVFTLSTHTKRIDEQERNLAALLAKFRIDCAEVTVLSDYSRQPSSKLLTEFEELISPFYYDDTQSESHPKESPQGMISQTELISQQERTWRSLRTAEQLQKYSSDADLIVMTLPVPRKGLISGSLYMAWLDMMSRNLPPTLFVRGNQQSVLTFYS